METEYETGYVYKIYKGNDCYIGSCKNIKRRMRDHRYYSKTEGQPGYEGKFYTYVRENGGMKTWEWEILDIYYNISRRDLVRIEGRYQKQLKPNLNSQVAGRTKAEWNVDNRDKNLKTAKRWYVDNREHMKRWEREKIACCTCGKLMGRSSMSWHKKRYNH